MLLLRFLIWLNLRFPFLSKVIALADYSQKAAAFSIYISASQRGISGINAGCGLLSIGFIFLPLVIAGIFFLISELTRIWVIPQNISIVTIRIWPGLTIVQGWMFIVLTFLVLGILGGLIISHILRLISMIRTSIWLRNYRRGYWIGIRDGVIQGARYAVILAIAASWLMVRYNTDAVIFLCGGIWVMSMLRYWRDDLFRPGDYFYQWLIVYIASFFLGGEMFLTMYKTIGV